MENKMTMDKEKLRLIVKNLESLVNCLKEELQSDNKNQTQYEEVASFIEDYDEVFSDDEEEDNFIYKN